jgi:hypothetical protein
MNHDRTSRRGWTTAIVKTCFCLDEKECSFLLNRIVREWDHCEQDWGDRFLKNWMSCFYLIVSLLESQAWTSWTHIFQCSSVTQQQSKWTWISLLNVIRVSFLTDLHLFLSNWLFFFSCRKSSFRRWVSLPFLFLIPFLLVSRVRNSCFHSCFGFRLLCHIEIPRQTMHQEVSKVNKDPLLTQTIPFQLYFE